MATQYGTDRYPQQGTQTATLLINTITLNILVEIIVKVVKLCRLVAVVLTELIQKIIF